MLYTYVNSRLHIPLLIVLLLFFTQCADKKKAVSVVKIPVETRIVRNTADTHLFIQQQVESLLMGEGTAIAGDSIFSTNALPKFYENRSFQPAWTDTSYAGHMLTLLAEADKEGLQK